MIVNHSFAKIVSVLFFFEFAAILVAIIMTISPGFHFTENPIIRFLGLLFCFIVAGIFYSFISEDEDTINGKDKGNFIIKEKIEYKRLIPIIIVVGIFVAFILFILLRSYGMV
jgi:hypothetical protein